jgi:hypothetical protein
MQPKEVSPFQQQTGPESALTLNITEVPNNIFFSFWCQNYDTTLD